MNKKRIVFIGSKSFIAKNVINDLKKFNYSIIKIPRTLVNLESKKSIKQLDKLIKNNDWIFFASGKVPVKNDSMYKKNIKMIENFCSAILSKNINHFFYLSSDAVYSDSLRPLSEKSKKNPDNLHGLMHLTRENIIRKIFPKGKITIFRPTLVFGSDDPHNGYGPNKFVRLAKNKKNIILFGNGEERRDHIFIKDLSKLICKCINKNLSGEFNLATGKLYSFMQIANIIKSKYPKTQILTSIRKGVMPHNGYRAFKINNVNYISNNFKFTTIEKWVNSL